MTGSIGSDHIRAAQDSPTARDGYVFPAMERIRMENLEGRHLLVTDLSELGPEEATALLQQTHLVPSRLPRERSVLSLAIVRGLRMGDGPHLQRVRVGTRGESLAPGLGH